MEHTEKKIIALGMFDGVHIGHRALVRKAKEMAEAENASCLVYSFSNHPNELLGKPYSLLTTNEERTKLLQDAGADEVVLEPFTEELMNIEPKEFLNSLCEKWNVKGIVAGFNYSFGKQAEGNPVFLKQYCDNQNILCEILPPIERGGLPVSSTRIRSYLKEGRILSAAGCLGYPYFLRGNALVTGDIVEYKVEGKKAFPKDGKYAIKVKTENQETFGYYMFYSPQNSDGVFYLDGFYPEKEKEMVRLTFVSEL